MRIYPLQNPSLPYAWGSPDGLSRTLGLPNPSGGPLAEVWMGAHPKAPSLAGLPRSTRRLDELIRSDPEGCLGADSQARFGACLPFLFKALSAARPLSIQVHPPKRRAERGFEKEERAGLAADAPDRNYRDPNHKPELSVALSSFEALCGFRRTEDIASLMKILAPEDHLRHFERLGRSSDRIELSVFFYTLMTLSQDSRHSMLETMLSRAARLLEEGRAPESDKAALGWLPRMARLWPDDIGVLSPLLLNYHRLAPGEAVFIHAGEPHAYLEGTALEIMANSDNVIRAALTDKNIDIPEFISVLSFDPGLPARVMPVEGVAGELLYPCPVGDFALSRLSVSEPREHRTAGPEILLCGEGQVVIESEGSSLPLSRGDSVFVCASASYWIAEGAGIVWRATTGAAPTGAETAASAAR